MNLVKCGAKLPILPLDGTKLYLFLSSVFSILSLVLVYIQIYKTIWWLPFSHTPYALNFYLIDFNVFFYIAILLTKDTIYMILVQLINSRLEHVQHLLHILFLILNIICLINAYLSYGLFKLLFLIYPIFIYLTLDFRSCLHWLKDPLHLDDAFNAFKFKHDCGNLEIFPNLLEKDFTNIQKFLSKFVKDATFTCLFNVYYASFLPCVLAPNVIYFQMGDVLLLALITFTTCLIHTLYHYLPYTFINELYSTCLHIKQLINNHILSNDPKLISCRSDNDTAMNGEEKPYKLAQQTYINLKKLTESPYYKFFVCPTNFITFLLISQSLSIAAQMFALYMNTHWNLVLSIGLLLFCNYYLLFKILREYFTLTKIYGHTPKTSSLKNKSE